MRTEKILKEIAEERFRQIDEEGFTPEHDLEEHAASQLCLAAISYAAPEPVFVHRHISGGSHTFCDPWPWHRKYDKRTKHDYRRRLVIAGAFIAAEIERLDREAEESKEQCQKSSSSETPSTTKE